MSLYFLKQDFSTGYMTNVCPESGEHDCHALNNKPDTPVVKLVDVTNKHNSTGVRITKF